MIAFRETVSTALAPSGGRAAEAALSGAAAEPFPAASLVPDAEGQLPDTEALGDEIARLAAHLHAATYQLLVLIRAFDEQEGWGGGFLSCAHWLSWRTGIGPGPAREKVRVARALATLPHLSRAMARGELSFSKVRALTRVASSENETELLELSRHATAAHIETLVRAWRRVDRLEDAESEAERHRSRHLWLYPDDDGSWVIRGRLDPEVGALLQKALEWAGEALYREEKGEAPGDATPIAEITAEQRRADALGLLAERALAESAGAADGLEDGSQAEEDRPRPPEDRSQAKSGADGPAPSLGRAEIGSRRARTIPGPGRPVPGCGACGGRSAEAGSGGEGDWPCGDDRQRQRRSRGDVWPLFSR